MITIIKLINICYHFTWVFLVAQIVKNHLQCGRPGFDPWVGKIPWRRAWQPTPVFLPGESHGQRSLVGYSSWGYKDLDMTEQLNTSLHIVSLFCEVRKLQIYFIKVK